MNSINQVRKVTEWILAYKKKKIGLNRDQEWGILFKKQSKNTFLNKK